MAFNLHGRNVLVTGASSGIGAATARLIASSGATVAIVSEREADLHAVADEICASGRRAVPFVVDFSRPDERMV